MESLVVDSPAMDNRFCHSRTNPREVQPKTKNPARRPGFVVDSHETRATAYPAECRYSGRRARDVIPAAARALVSTVAV
jgi:hypothetical protein